MFGDTPSLPRRPQVQVAHSSSRPSVRTGTRQVCLRFHMCFTISMLLFFFLLFFENPASRCRRLKVEIALALGKNVRDKREDIKAREAKRDIQRIAKNIYD